MSAPTNRHEDPASSDEAPRAGRGVTSEWVATWSRGSLGVLGRFQLRDRLGDGGFGEVYLAYDPRLDRDVAIKVLRQANPSDRVMERFFREARAAARLDHPNIVAVYDSGFDGGRCWVAYQRVIGRPLWWHFDHQPIDAVTAARIFRDLADAVQYAHKLGVVHRDIKPANILIDEFGRPRLIDFGLARRFDYDSTLTHDGAVVGTPAYMSPEQAQGLSRQVDERSDVFSLGVVLYETMAGRRPDFASTVRSPADGNPAALTSRAIENLSQIAPSVPAGLVRICERAAAERPEDRYPNARALADDLDAWLKSQGQTQDRPSVAAAALEPPARKTATLARVAWAGLLSLGLFASYLAATHLDVFRPRAAANPLALHGPTADAPPAKPDQASPEPRPASEAVAPKSPADETDATPVAAPAKIKSADASTPVAKAKAHRRSTGASKIKIVGNKDSHWYHTTNCTAVTQMSAENRVDDLKNEENAKAQGYKLCKFCQKAAKTPAAAEPTD
nr:serine/threonine-protein kinase [Paludisphaera mucosa]